VCRVWHGDALMRIGADLFSFSPHVAYATTDYVPGDDAPFAGISLPRELDRAVQARRTEFLAGRACARSALRSLADGRAGDAIPIGPDRAPVWPAGIVGAITHTHGFAAAAVAREVDVLGVGFDAEREIPPDMIGPMLDRVATRAELLELCERAQVSEALALTVIFSAKESIFKCLSRRVGRIFDFADVTMVELSMDEGTFVAELRVDLGELARGTRLGGRFAVSGDLVHTGIALAVGVGSR
jgi:enterobactin synthetase component D